MARRSIIAEIHHQAMVAARERAKAEREAERARALKEKRLAKEAKEAHVVAMEDLVEKKNQDLAQAYSEIDSILTATLEVDDYVDLNQLRKNVSHPPFDRTDLETPIPPPVEVSPFIPPQPPSGISALFGKKKHEKAVVAAKEAHDRKLEDYNAALLKHTQAEDQRIKDLELERARYNQECSDRETEVSEHNKAIDKLIADLGYGAIEAVQEYVSIVLANSVYPDHFPVEHNFEFDPNSAELQLRVLVPSPDQLPKVKEYKYKKSSNEILESTLPQKACKDRYANAIHQAALRSIHEIFEADRRSIIKTISLEVGTETINPATGKNEFFLFVATGAERESFMEIDLANVVPTSTLSHLGASISKDPYSLIAADSSGIRRS